MSFDLFVGIDYSGAETPDSPLRGLQVFAAGAGQEPKAIHNSDGAHGNCGSWSRRAVAKWLIECVASGQKLLVGIDHAFSFPKSYLDRNHISSWPQFLDDFCERRAREDALCPQEPAINSSRCSGSGRLYDWQHGSSEELRLCECWTSGSKGVFQFDMHGSNAIATHAGIPWLRHVREQAQSLIHVWPFDGWQLPPDRRSVIVEVCAPMLRKRYPRAARTADEHDAYAVARWLREAVARGAIERYLNPPLTVEERELAALEGWIFGVS